MPKMSKLFSKFEKVAIFFLAKATITVTGDNLLYIYIQSLLSVSCWVEFIERQTGLDEIFHTQEETRELLGVM